MSYSLFLQRGAPEEVLDNTELLSKVNLIHAHGEYPKGHFMPPASLRPTKFNN